MSSPASQEIVEGCGRRTNCPQLFHMTFVRSAESTREQAGGGSIETESAVPLDAGERFLRGGDGRGDGGGVRSMGDGTRQVCRSTHPSAHARLVDAGHAAESRDRSRRATATAASLHQSALALARDLRREEPRLRRALSRKRGRLFAGVSREVGEDHRAHRRFAWSRPAHVSEFVAPQGCGHSRHQRGNGRTSISRSLAERSCRGAGAAAEAASESSVRRHHHRCRRPGCRYSRRFRLYGSPRRLPRDSSSHHTRPRGRAGRFLPRTPQRAGDLRRLAGALFDSHVLLLPAGVLGHRARPLRGIPNSAGDVPAAPDSALGDALEPRHARHARCDSRSLQRHHPDPDSRRGRWPCGADAEALLRRACRLGGSTSRRPEARSSRSPP